MGNAALSKAEVNRILRRHDTTLEQHYATIRGESDAAKRHALHRECCLVSLHMLELQVTKLFLISPRTLRMELAARYLEKLTDWKVGITELDAHEDGAYSELILALERLRPHVEAAKQGLDRPGPVPSEGAPGTRDRSVQVRAGASPHQLLDSSWRAQATAPLLP